MPNRNFVIIIGGPGIYFACDTIHDKSWKNYVIPMQLAAKERLYRLDNETVHWLVFAPAYRKRWSDDANITSSEKKELGFFGLDRYTRKRKTLKTDTWLHRMRKKAADDVKKKVGPSEKWATSYLHRISQICRENNIDFHALDKPADFWNYLGALGNGSISRVWYCGHAIADALFLDLDHEVPAGACRAISNNILTIEELRSHASTLKPKFSTDANKTSEFYGCNTASFAREWNKQFEVATAGAGNKITFAAIVSGSNTKNVLERLRTQTTSSGSPDWKTFSRPGKTGN